MMNTENVVPHLREEAVISVGDLLEGGVTTGIRRQAIHGRKNNDAFKSNSITGKHASRVATSRRKQRKPWSRYDARTRPTSAHSRKLARSEERRVGKEERSG